MVVKKLNDTQDKDYSGLFPTFDYDKTKATLLAELANETTKLQARLEYLQTIAKENAGLEKFLWKTGEGEVIALHDIKDEHLKNIIGHVTGSARELSPQLVAEARSRGINPDEYKKPVRAVIGRGIILDDEDEEDPWY